MHGMEKWLKIVQMHVYGCQAQICIDGFSQEQRPLRTIGPAYQDLTPKGVVFSFLFFSPAYQDFVGVYVCRIILIGLLRAPHIVSPQADGLYMT